MANIREGRPALFFASLSVSRPNDVSPIPRCLFHDLLHLGRVACQILRPAAKELLPVPKAPGHSHGVHPGRNACLHIRTRVSQIQAALWRLPELAADEKRPRRIRLFRHARLLSPYCVKISAPEDRLDIFHGLRVRLIGKYRCADPLFLQKAQQMGNTVIRRHVLHAVF